MRKLLVLAVVASLTIPALAHAAWEPSRRAPRKRGRPAPGLVDRSARPPLYAAPPTRGTVIRPAPRVTWGGPSHVVGIAPAGFWLGGSWGWGYRPLWPPPEYSGAEPVPYGDEGARLQARLEAYGAATNDQAAGTLALSFEGRGGGMNAGVTAFTVPGTDPTTGAASTLTLGSVNATWSVLSESAFRVRLELGGSMLSVPSDGRWSGTSYANTLSFGPQIGVSGQVGLVGPLGFEGHARVTPFPVPVLDTKAAVVVRGGAVAFSAGWRVIEVRGDGIDAPEAAFRGPEVGLQIGF